MAQRARADCDCGMFLWTIQNIIQLPVELNGYFKKSWNLDKKPTPLPPRVTNHFYFASVAFEDLPFIAFLEPGLNAGGLFVPFGAYKPSATQILVALSKPWAVVLKNLSTLMAVCPLLSFIFPRIFAFTKKAFCSILSTFVVSRQYVMVISDVLLIYLNICRCGS